MFKLIETKPEKKKKDIKRSVAKRACLVCRSKKIKCDGEITVFQQHEAKCTNCQNANIDTCEFIPSRRGGKKPSKSLNYKQTQKREFKTYLQDDQKILKNTNDSTYKINHAMKKIKQAGKSVQLAEIHSLSFPAVESEQKLEFPSYAPLNSGLEMQYLPVNDPFDKPITHPKQVTGHLEKDIQGKINLQSEKQSVLPLKKQISASFPYGLFESKPASPKPSFALRSENTNLPMFSNAVKLDHETGPSLHFSDFHSRNASISKINPNYQPQFVNLNPGEGSKMPSFDAHLFLPASINVDNKILEKDFNQNQLAQKNHAHSKTLSRILNDIFPKSSTSEPKTNTSGINTPVVNVSDKFNNAYEILPPPPPISNSGNEFFQHHHNDSLMYNSIFKTIDVDSSIAPTLKGKGIVNDLPVKIDKSGQNSIGSALGIQDHARNLSGYWLVPSPTHEISNPSSYQYPGVSNLGHSPVNQYAANSQIFSNIHHNSQNKPKLPISKNSINLDNKFLSEENTANTLKNTNNQKLKTQNSDQQTSFNFASHTEP
ncbi:hypothetical protein QEN19_002355 [Hanseniaspora menglaensis]